VKGIFFYKEDIRYEIQIGSCAATNNKQVSSFQYIKTYWNKETQVMNILEGNLWIYLYTSYQPIEADKSCQ